MTFTEILQEAMTYRQALKILGLNDSATKEEIERVGKQKMQAAHPDKGGTDREFIEVRAAIEYLKKNGLDRKADRERQKEWVRKFEQDVIAKFTSLIDKKVNSKAFETHLEKITGGKFVVGKSSSKIVNNPFSVMMIYNLKFVQAQDSDDSMYFEVNLSATVNPSSGNSLPSNLASDLMENVNVYYNTSALIGDKETKLRKTRFQFTKGIKNLEPEDIFPSAAIIRAIKNSKSKSTGKINKRSFEEILKNRLHAQQIRGYKDTYYLKLNDGEYYLTLDRTVYKREAFWIIKLHKNGMHPTWPNRVTPIDQYEGEPVFFKESHELLDILKDTKKAKSVPTFKKLMEQLRKESKRVK